MQHRRNKQKKNVEDNSSARGATDGQMGNSPFSLKALFVVLVSISVFLWDRFPSMHCCVNTMWDALDLHMSLSEVCPELLSCIYDLPLMTEKIHSESLNIPEQKREKGYIICTALAQNTNLNF